MSAGLLSLMPVPAQPENSADHAPLSPVSEPRAVPPAEARTESRALPASELDAALQLLVERARYITGATGAALALAQDKEMVCRASAGPSAPPVGARLQVESGLTGESVTRKQLLRCDHAENDPRVNVETCRELGIASIVVLPLLSRAGQVQGLFELFSDHPYAFEERDLVALERMAELTRTALELSEKREVPVVVAPRAPESQPEQAETVPSETLQTKLEASSKIEDAGGAQIDAVQTEIVPEPVVETSGVAPAPMASSVEDVGSVPVDSPIPDSMLRVQKCSSCGFPVSAGRSLCIDCENKPLGAEPNAGLPAAEFVPDFLTSQKPPDTSWLADHVNLLAVLVLVLSIVVAIVVFR